MFVLGIDPGLSRTGYAVIEAAGGVMRPVAAGVIRTDPAASLSDRLAELYADLESLIAEYRPDEAAIEEVFVNRNLQTATAVGRASGVAILAAARAGIPVHEYTPSAVKLAVAGYGDAAKAQVQAMVARRLGLESAPGPADAADALAVALCHLQGAGLRRAVDEATR
ncbi:MAG: crossover junction endodeoxyribonuclease RuvC [Actinobacteria bacterium RBG_16_68_21]|nr:MAG: crossover junction endodeoxyribonuclease RuvC [Actinobacteria bacterium RBG_16_68_21]